MSMSLYGLVDASGPTGYLKFFEGQAPVLSAEKDLRWLPVVDSIPEIAPGEVLEEYILTVDGDTLRRTRGVRVKTFEELLSECHEKRLASYPPIGDQLDAAYKARLGDDSEQRALDVVISTVKSSYPKPAIS